ncbi:MAG TPA: ATP-dependent Clp protease proteolytic subunit [Holophagaceae bacterium]|nr:ATP-dependent Clp protease proteolytic subunit [Holophagaceae bacterium]
MGLRADSLPEVLEELTMGPKERILSPHTTTIYVHGEMDQPMARRFVEALEELRFGRQASAALIDIASDGGEYFALATMLSAMAGSHMALATFASGHAFSAAAILLSAGHPNCRFISPYGAAMVHSLITAHPPQGIEELEGLTKFEASLNHRLMATFAKNCGTTAKKLDADIRAGGGRTLWLLPEQAKALGLVDHIGIPGITQQMSYDLEGVKG